MWKPSKIANPDYFEDKEPLKNLDPIGAVAVEIWTMDQGYYFDNVLVTNDAEKAKEYREKYWQPKHEVEEVCCDCLAICYLSMACSTAQILPAVRFAVVNTVKFSLTADSSE